MSVRTADVDNSLLHLDREAAEASLCGIPRSALGRASHADDVVCF